MASSLSSLPPQPTVTRPRRRCYSHFSSLPSLISRQDLFHHNPLISSSIIPSGRFRLPLQVKCSAQTVVATDISQGTPIRPTNVLVVGATGTLGRQIVRKALDEGYDVRCLVRPRPAPADFLRDWGAIVANGDLSKPETIPATLVGIHTIIDCATGRPEEPIRKVDWEGKVALIQCAKAMGIQKYKGLVQAKFFMYWHIMSQK